VRNFHLPPLNKIPEEGWQLLCSPLVNSSLLKQLLSITFPLMNSASRQALVRLVFGPPARSVMVSSRSELEVTSRSTVKLSVIVELTPQSSLKKRLPSPPRKSLGESGSLSTTLKLLQQVRDLSLDGQESIEDSPNHGDPGDRNRHLAVPPPL